MRNILIIKLVMLWLYFIVVVTIGNIYLNHNWYMVCEILQIINMGMIVYIASRIYYLMPSSKRRLFKWFIWSKACLGISAIFYFIVNYVLYINNFNKVISLLYLTPAILWLTIALIYWCITIKNFQFRNNWIVLFTVLLAMRAVICD